MKRVQSILVVLVALAALSAVASAYEPIADAKVPSPKSPVKPAGAATSRKLLQQTLAKSNMDSQNNPKVMWGGYVVTPPYWVAGMDRAMNTDPWRDSATQRRFDMASATK